MAHSSSCFCEISLSLIWFVVVVVCIGGSGNCPKSVNAFASSSCAKSSNSFKRSSSLKASRSLKLGEDIKSPISFAKKENLIYDEKEKMIVKKT